VFCSSFGKYHGRLFSTESKFGALRRSQYRSVLDKSLMVSIAVKMIEGKLSNQRTFLMRNRHKKQDTIFNETIKVIENTLESLGDVNDIGSLHGLEGYAGAAYFESFASLLKYDFGFINRVKRPPTDPVNSLLSLGYTLLVYDAQAAIRVVGLDPFLGFLHSTQYSKPSLALDLIEEFRTIIVDSIVIKLINNCILKREDFTQPMGFGSMVLLKKDALKTFIEHYEDRMLTNIFNPLSDSTVTYRRCLEFQARQIASIISGKKAKYDPFLVK
jgi:CRISPR-associated protein Cas1